MMPDERPQELEIYLDSEPELPWNRAEDFIQGAAKGGKLMGQHKHNPTAIAAKEGKLPPKRPKWADVLANALKAADAIEELGKERTGVWITPRKNYCKCSVCGTGFHHYVGAELDNYCAECGAKMKGKIEMRKIDACPYCGCEDAYVESYEHHVGAIRYRVCCPKCGVYLDSGYWQTADRAIEEWNNRSNSMWWISTKKQHPFAEYGEGKSVLTVDSMGEKRVLYFDGGNWCWPSGEVLETARAFPVTHWMPLPEPPKEEA